MSRSGLMTNCLLATSTSLASPAKASPEWVQRRGFADSRTCVFHHVIDTVRAKEPRVAILENVRSLLEKNMEDTWQIIREELERLAAEKDYTFEWAKLDAKDHGLPTSRSRIFMLLYKREHHDGSFRWPTPLPKPSIEPWLDGPPVPLHVLEKIKPKAKGQAKSLEEALLKLHKQGGNNPLTEPHLTVLGMPSMTTARDYCPYILKQSKPIWLLNRGRLLNIRERRRLGFNPDRLEAPVSVVQLGNTMALNVLERLLCRILSAVGLAGRLQDRWENGSAQEALTSTAQK